MLLADDFADGGTQPIALPELAQTIDGKLRQRTYECVVCTDTIGFGDPLWACRRCYGVFHRPCVAHWATNQPSALAAAAGQSPSTDGRRLFRCPLCQGENDTETTREWWCFCGKVRDPRVQVDLTPSSCGELCNRVRGSHCPHRCAAICHPGPCAPCSVQRRITCHCGHSDMTVACGTPESSFACEEVCGKLLSCGRHRCEFRCHDGDCAPCGKTREAHCYCGRVQDAVRKCEASAGFSCRQRCPHMKLCKLHQCDMDCHEGPCNPCEFEPSRWSTCGCGKKPLWRLHHNNPTLPSRVVCTDPIPSCGEVCGRSLPCGHTCPATCHDGPCAPCVRIVNVHCRCKGSMRPLACFTSYVEPAARWPAIAEAHDVQRKHLPQQWPLVCERHCTKKKSCGRHRCDTICCAGGPDEHQCMQVCNRRAPCGIHVCGQLCHAGACPRCQNTSFEPLYCRCRRSVLEPPVPCGTPPPVCLHPCIVPRNCGHPPHHACHPENVPCPDCMVLVEKRCPSHDKPNPYHRPCSMPALSCGRTCSKKAECCGEICQKVCHVGPCAHAPSCSTAGPPPPTS